METTYYHGGKIVSKDSFEKAREALIEERIEDSKNGDILISIMELDYYLNELDKFE